MINYKQIINDLEKQDKDGLMKLLFYYDIKDKIKENNLKSGKILSLEKINELVDINLKFYNAINNNLENELFSQGFPFIESYYGLYNEDLIEAIDSCNNYPKYLELKKAVDNYNHNSTYNAENIIDYDYIFKNLKQIDENIILKLRIYCTLEAYTDLKILNDEEISELIDKLLEYYQLSEILDDSFINTENFAFGIFLISENYGKYGLKKILEILRNNPEYIQELDNLFDNLI